MKLNILQLLWVFVVCGSVRGSLDEQLDYYETLDYIEVETVAKRSVDDLFPHHRHVKFSALGRNFSLHLEVARGLFSTDFNVHIVHSNGSRTYHDLDTSNFYFGTVEGEENSEVHAFLYDGALSATISVPGESITIEPAWRHINGLVRENKTMLVYKGSDVKWPKDMDKARTGGDGPSFCGAAHTDGKNETLGFSESHDEDEHDMSHSRRKRDTAGNKVCRLIGVADYKFYQNIAGNNIYDAANYIVGIIQKVNLIYKATNFGLGTGYGVELAGLRLHDGPTAVTGTNTHYNMIKSWSNSYDLLTEFSYDSEWSKYCLAHLFTYQSFANNVLGLAFIASSSFGKLGGICSPSSVSNGKTINYNTGLTSTRYTSGGTVLAKQSSLVTAHEIGHNWGSEHDPTSGDCAPSSIIGNGKYLMYPYSVTGEDSNNNQFSSCSKNYINSVLANKAASCFTVDTSNAACGNGKIDSGEACDGGSLGKFNLDKCCDPTCKLRNNAQCSPMNHACCTDQCKMASAGVVCSGDLQEICTGQAVCTGSSLTCPQGSFKARGTACLDGGQCDGAGTCRAYCEFRSLQSCVCDSVSQSCLRCCKDPAAATPTCQPQNTTAFHQNGRPCAVGYCDKGVCISSNPSFISRFYDLIDKINFDFVAEAFKTNMVAFIQVFSLIIFVPASCFIWCRDKKSQKWFRNEHKIEKRTNRNLMFDQDGRPIARPVTKPYRDNPYITMEPRSLTARPYSSRTSRSGGERSQRNKVKPNEQRKARKKESFRDLDDDSLA